MILSPDDDFGRYTVLAFVGQGGMGVVYRAHDRHLDRVVALKVLRAEESAAEKETGAARLLREGRAAAAISHPNAVAIFDVGEWNGTPFMAMELVEGETLRAHIGDPRDPLGRRVKWLVQIASALAAAHKRGVVHRDVKPENVIVGNDGNVRVLDFGIARRAPAGRSVPAARGLVKRSGLAERGAAARYRHRDALALYGQRVQEDEWRRTITLPGRRDLRSARVAGLRGTCGPHRAGER